MMKSIEQIALEVQHSMSDFQIAMLTEEFYAEFLRRCLSKIVKGVEPIGYLHGNKFYPLKCHDEKFLLAEGTNLYATPTEAILAVEKQVAEACAKVVIADGELLKNSNADPRHIAIAIATSLRAGKWRKYL